MKKKLIIEGMSCQHCVKHVKDALVEVKGVNEVDVSLEEKFAVINVSEEIHESVLKEAVEDAGYDVTEILTI